MGSSSADRFGRIAIVGDDVGIPPLLEHVGAGRIAAIVVASIRELPRIAATLASRGVLVLTQPRRSSPDYPAFVEAFAATRPELLLCNSYSMKIGADLLALVQGNAINAHAALLPRNRGPNPIQWAIIRGERVTGVTLHYMTDEIDAGDIVAQREVRIDADESWIAVRDKVALALRELLAADLPRILAGTNARTPQDPALATLNYRLNPDSPRIDFAHMSDEDVYNLVRAQVSPLAGAYLENARGERRRFTQMLSRGEIAELRAHWQAVR